MTTNQAVRILIRHAAANIRGTAQGIRPEISDSARTEVREAIERLFESAYRRKMDSSDRYNLGL